MICCLKAHGRLNSAQSKLGLEVDIVNSPTTQPRKALIELDIVVDTIIDIYNIGNFMLPQDRVQHDNMTLFAQNPL